jgi:hypothetical protein
MSTINFADKIFAREIMNQFVKLIAPFNAFARDFSDEAAKVGDAVAVPLIGSLSATTFGQTDNSGNPYEQTGGTISAITVNLTENHIVPVDITDLQAVNQSPARAENFAVQAANALFDRVFARMLSVVTTANYETVSTIASTGWSTNLVLALRLKMGQNNVPKTGRSLIINPAAENTIISNPAVIQWQNYGSAAPIQDGTIPKLLGYDIYSVNNIPVNGFSLNGLAIHRDAIAVAMRLKPPQDTSMLSAYEVMRDAASGCVFGYRRHYNPGSGKYHINLEALFGQAAAVTQGGKLVVQTD